MGAGAYLDESYANCTRKHSYATEARARRAGYHAYKLGRTMYYRTYQCPLCNGWHWTHKKAITEDRRGMIKLEITFHDDDAQDVALVLTKYAKYLQEKCNIVMQYKQYKPSAFTEGYIGAQPFSFRYIN